MTTSARPVAALLGMASLVLALVSCGGGIGGTGAPQPTTQGTLRVALTDAPACGYDEVNVSIRSVSVHASATAADADAGWRTVVDFGDTPKRVDLLTLTNGVIEELGQALLPEGRYTQLRLELAENSSADPFANSVVPSGGAERALQTPSGQQSGLKLRADLDVSDGQLTDVVLDFDACRSVVRAGNSGRYLLKPVIQVLPRPAGEGSRVSGYLDLALATGSTTVSVQQNGRVIRATPPITSGTSPGRFELYPLPAGSYDLVVTAPGRATIVITGVPVDAASATVVSTPTVRLSPPSSGSRGVAGRVTVSPAAGDTLAGVRALQALTGGPVVEVASTPVDAGSGTYALSLPTAATVRANFAAGPTSLMWTADPLSAGRYTVEGSASGFGASKTQDVDLGATTLPAIDFAFP